MAYTDEQREAWRQAVAEQVADPSSRPFIASDGHLLVMGGVHFGEFDYCWCQERMELHGCGHRHGEHRRYMD